MKIWKILFFALVILIVLATYRVFFVYADVSITGTNPQFYYDENDTATTTTSSTYNATATLTFTPDALSTYFVLGAWQATLNASNRIQSRMLYPATSFISSTTEDLQPSNTTDYLALGAMDIPMFGTSPASTVYSIQYASQNNASVAGAKNARLIAIKKGPQDQFATSTAVQTDNTSGSTYNDAVTLTFTPATSGDYLIIACARLNSPVGDRVGVAININNNGYATSTFDESASQNYWPWCAERMNTLSAVSNTLKIQYAFLAGANRVQISNAQIIAIRLDAFKNNYYSENLTRQTSGSTSFVDGLTLTQTLQNDNFLVMTDGLTDINSNTVAVEASSTSLVNNRIDMLNTPRTAGVIFDPVYTFYVQNLNAQSYTFKTQWLSKNGSTVGLDDTNIDLLQLSIPVGASGFHKILLNGFNIKLNSNRKYILQ